MTKIFPALFNRLMKEEYIPTSSEHQTCISGCIYFLQRMGLNLNQDSPLGYSFMNRYNQVYSHKLSEDLYKNERHFLYLSPKQENIIKNLEYLISRFCGAYPHYTRKQFITTFSLIYFMFFSGGVDSGRDIELLYRGMEAIFPNKRLFASCVYYYREVIAKNGYNV